MNTIDPKVLDFANHHADATEADIRELCDGVLAYGFNSAFVNPIYVKLAKSFVQDKAKVGTVVSFPLGGDLRDVKIHAIREAIQDGADELDIVPDIAHIIEGNDMLFQEELTVLTRTAKVMRKTTVVKIIIETGLFVPEHFLDADTPQIRTGREHIVNASRMIERSGAVFIKICTGMGKRGASVDDVKLIRSVVSPAMKIKCAGGIDTKEEALALLSAGANRLGTSHAVEIIKNN